MPEKSGITLNRAAQDVVLERQRQVSGEGYSLYHDDGYVKGELSEAGATYASLAGKPGSLSTQWPWGAKTFKPSADRRRDLVKAAALILAEIERLDRQQLIRHAIVRRDENGWWHHPGIPDFGGTEDPAPYKEWAADQGLELKTWDMDSDLVEHPYFDGAAHCNGWEPESPGPEWFLMGIFDTDDGPHVQWARRVVTP
ncbi:hypothetical protein SJI00_07185 [Pseudomonas sp. RP23018S]|uniref:hypothetical protein n=1 Tax=Pseudomonas sp. RP23018S TaxID=3096037 RepID=UPI002ACAB0D0|nr:hypothetical protein [Pseudomonas sp. RP23018S]MDZ5602553.1 hypothetical protein [Pseudomonas sp. RP23018S]